MRYLIAVTTIVLVLGMATVSQAGIDEGDWEVGLGGNFFFSEFHDNYGLEFTLGYFVTAEIQVGGWIAYHNQDLDGEVSRDGDDLGDIKFSKTWWDIAFFAAYYFQVEGEWAPYIGGFIGYEDGELDSDGSDLDFDRSGLEIGGILGVKYFVSEKTTIFIEYRLTWRDADEWEWKDDSDYVIEDDALTHTFLFGISVLF
jgi:opacity protein-like surface antigen